MTDLYNEALEIALTMDVSTPPDAVVVYSVSYLPTKENKEKALECIRNHPQKMMIDHTPCGQKLIELGLDGCNTLLDEEKNAHIWKVASRRFIEKASGDVTAFVEKADPRSVFRSMELPCILQNPAIKTINGQKKQDFANIFNNIYLG